MITFDNIFGQDRAVLTLRQAWASQRLPHGLLFSGPMGVGKATTAAALAGLFLCKQPRGDKPCGKCESCQAMVGNGHPDYHVIVKEMIRAYDKTGKSKATVLAADVIREEVIKRASRSTVLGNGKVFVIEQADLMNPAAQNSLLKTLEEPSGRSLLILLTEQPGSMLPTIRSRCQLIQFSELDLAWVQAELRRRGIDADVAENAVYFTGGSIGLALRWLEDGVIAAAKTMTAELDALLAGQPRSDFADWFKAAGDAYAEKQLVRDELSSKDQATREGLSVYLRLAADHLRHGMRISDDPDALARACNAIDAIARAEQYLDGNVSVPLTFQQLSLSLASA